VGLGDHRHGGEAEGAEGFARWQARLCQMPLDAPPVSFGNLVLLGETCPFDGAVLAGISIKLMHETGDAG